MPCGHVQDAGEISSRVPESRRICTGRVVSIIQRNWREYCGVIEKSTKPVSWFHSVVVVMIIFYSFALFSYSSLLYIDIILQRSRYGALLNQAKLGNNPAVTHMHSVFTILSIYFVITKNRTNAYQIFDALLQLINISCMPHSYLACCI